jgi:hypothetical protein
VLTVINKSNIIKLWSVYFEFTSKGDLLCNSVTVSWCLHTDYAFCLSARSLSYIGKDKNRYFSSRGWVSMQPHFWGPFCSLEFQDLTDFAYKFGASLKGCCLFFALPLCRVTKMRPFLFATLSNHIYMREKCWRDFMKLGVKKFWGATFRQAFPFRSKYQDRLLDSAVAANIRNSTR